MCLLEETGLTGAISSTKQKIKRTIVFYASKLIYVLNSHSKKMRQNHGFTARIKLQDLIGDDKRSLNFMRLSKIKLEYSCA